VQRYEVIGKLTSRSTTGRWKMRKWGASRTGSRSTTGY